MKVDKCNSLVSLSQGLLLVCVFLSDGVSSLYSGYKRKELPGGGVGFLPAMRRGRNSKVLLDDAELTPRRRGAKVARGRTDVSALLADLKQKLAEVQNESFDVVEKQRERLPKENTANFNIEQHNFNLEEDTRNQGVAVPSQQKQFYTQQQQQQYYNQQQQFKQQQYSQQPEQRQFVQGEKTRNYEE